MRGAISSGAEGAFREISDDPGGRRLQRHWHVHRSGRLPLHPLEQDASNLSITVDVHITNALAPEEVDLQATSLGAMAQFNAIAARNPHTQQTTSSTTEEMWVSAANFNNPRGYGRTGYDFGANNRIVYSRIEFNTQIEWNFNYDYTCRFVAGGNEVCKADAHKVVRHEFGHSQGLAHVNPVSVSGVLAIMVQHDPITNYHSLQADDRSGIISIYGAYP